MISLKFTRSFLFSCAIFVVILVAMHQFVLDKITNLQEGAVIEASEAANLDLTRLFINEVLVSVESILPLTSDRRNQPTVLADENFSLFNQRVKAFMLGTGFLKIKIYNLDGVTIYSSDPSQLGSDYSDNIAFKIASKGGQKSDAQIRAEFAGYSGTVFNRDVISSYVPIRERSLVSSGSLGPIIGVAEVYSDRTAVMDNARSVMRELKFILAIAMMVLGLMISATIWYLSISMTERHMRAAELDE